MYRCASNNCCISSDRGTRVFWHKFYCVWICLWYTHSSKLQGLGQGPLLPRVSYGIQFPELCLFLLTLNPTWVLTAKPASSLLASRERSQPGILCLGATVWNPIPNPSAADYLPTTFLITYWPFEGHLHLPLESADQCFPRLSWHCICQGPQITYHTPACLPLYPTLFTEPC